MSSTHHLILSLLYYYTTCLHVHVHVPVHLVWLPCACTYVLLHILYIVYVQPKTSSNSNNQVIFLVCWRFTCVGSSHFTQTHTVTTHTITITHPLTRSPYHHTNLCSTPIEQYMYLRVGTIVYSYSVANPRMIYILLRAWLKPFHVWETSNAVRLK